jgi:hypothetical protein
MTAAGPEGRKAYVPEGYALLDAFYTGKIDGQ